MTPSQNSVVQSCGTRGFNDETGQCNPPPSTDGADAVVNRTAAITEGGLGQAPVNTPVDRCTSTYGNAEACSNVTNENLLLLDAQCQRVGLQGSQCYSQHCANPVRSIADCVGLVRAVADQREGEAAYRAALGEYTSPNLTECTDRREEAEECCQNPLKCTFGIDALDGASAGQLDRLIVGAVGNATAGEGQSAQCRFIKNANQVMAFMHTGMAARCGGKVNSCKRVCNESIRFVEQEMNRMNCSRFNARTGGGTLVSAASIVGGVGRSAEDAYRQHCAQAQSDLAALRTPYQNCRDELSDSLNQLGSQLRSNIEGYMQASSCEGDSTQTAGPTDLFNPNAQQDCTIAANASSPICQFQCTQPGAANNPLCRGFSAGGGVAASSIGGRSDFNSASLGGAPNLSGLSADASQVPNIPLTEITSAKSAGITGNTGNSSVGGASTSSKANSSGGTSPQSAGGQGKLNTNVANAQGQSGYSSGGGGGGGGGGGAGAFTSSSKKKGKDDEKFDFGKMLSLMNKNKGGTGTRSIAGFGSSKRAKDIDKAYGDIFKKISDAWFRQCETDAYDDCKSNVRREYNN